MTITRNYYSNTIFYSLLVLIIMPGMIMLIGYTSQEVVERTVEEGKVLEVVRGDASEQVAVKMQLSSGEQIQMESLPKTVKIGDKLPIIVDHYVNKDKLTYRFDRAAWKYH